MCLDNIVLTIYEQLNSLIGGSIIHPNFIIFHKLCFIFYEMHFM